MDNYNNKVLRSIAEVASKIMSEQLKGNQHKIDANKNKKIDSEDFKILRGEKKMKEEVEQVEEGADVEYHVVLRHPKEGKKVVRVSALTPSEAAEKAKSDHPDHKVDKIRDPQEKNYFRTEEVEQVEEAYQKNMNPHNDLAGRGSRTSFNKTAAGKKREFDRGTELLKDKMKFTKSQGGIAGPKGKLPEEVEQVDEAAWPDFKKQMEKNKTTGNFDKKKISTGTVYTRKHKSDAEPEEGETKKKVSEMIDLYNEYGLKSISEMISTKENNEEETIEESKDMPTSLHPAHDPKAARFMAMQVRGTPVKGKAQSAKQEEPKKEPKMKKEEVEQVEEKVVGEYDDPASRMRKKENEEKRKEREKEKVEERTLTEPEMSKREEVVKSMKKGMQGFKQRYGDRAKSVMYATATKIAKGD